MSKNKRKINKARKQHKLVDIVEEHYKGKKLVYNELTSLSKSGHKMCGYLRSPHYDNISYYGYCALTQHSCSTRHSNYEGCGVYDRHFFGEKR